MKWFKEGKERTLCDLRHHKKCGMAVLDMGRWKGGRVWVWLSGHTSSAFGHSMQM